MTFTLPTAPANPQIALFDDTKPDSPAAIARANQKTNWSATYSPCERFRYLLFRPLVGGTRSLGRILWVMMNPSTATEFKNDPTISKCMAFSEQWGYADIEIANTFALRSSKPEAMVEEMKAGGNPIGDENDRHLVEAAQRADMIVYACGVPPFGKRAPASLRDRPREVFELLRRYKANIQCLAITKDGNPYHPLYLPMTTPLIPFKGWKKDPEIMGYTLAAPVGVHATLEDAPFDEMYPYKPATGERHNIDPNTGTIDLTFAQWWDTVPEALAFRGKADVFGEGEVKVVKKVWEGERGSLRAEKLLVQPPT